ncbi:MAG: hypothetical protein QW607_06555 [Desulfurococcaceae archaeon]
MWNTLSKKISSAVHASIGAIKKAVRTYFCMKRATEIVTTRLP